MHRRIGLMAGGAAVVLAAAVGCSSNATGNGGPNGDTGGNAVLNLSPVAFIKSALAKASDDKTVHMSGTMTMAGSQMTMVADEKFGDDLELSANVDVQGTTISEIFTGDKIYMKMPQLSELLGGKPWAELDLGSLGSLGSSFQSLIDSAKNTDPMQQLQPLLASGDLHKVGTETVDGVKAEHYSGTVDPATAFDDSAAAKNLTPAQITQLKSLMKSVKNEIIDVWVASSGLPVRLSVSSETTAGAVKVDMHLSKWGQPVSITAPPADQVSDISSMLGDLSGLGGTSG